MNKYVKSSPWFATGRSLDYQGKHESEEQGTTVICIGQNDCANETTIKYKNDIHVFRKYG